MSRCVAMVVQEVGCLRCSAQDGGDGNIQNVRLSSSQSGSGIFCRGPKVIWQQQLCDIIGRMVEYKRKQVQCRRRVRECDFALGSGG